MTSTRFSSLKIPFGASSILFFGNINLFLFCTKLSFMQHQTYAFEMFLNGDIFLWSCGNKNIFTCHGTVMETKNANTYVWHFDAIFLCNTWACLKLKNYYFNFSCLLTCLSTLTEPSVDLRKQSLRAVLEIRYIWNLGKTFLKYLTSKSSLLQLIKN